MPQGKLLTFLIVLLFSLGLSTSLPAQAKYHRKPYWVSMMNDPNVNYVEACKAYDAFWKGRDKPRDEEEIIGQHNNVNQQSDKDHYKAEHRSKRETQEDKDLQQFAFLCKKFENWRRQNAPYVKTDGHLMTADERLKAWHQQNDSKK